MCLIVEELKALVCMYAFACINNLFLHCDQETGFKCHFCTRFWSKECTMSKVSRSKALRSSCQKSTKTRVKVAIGMLTWYKQDACALSKSGFVQCWFTILGMLSKTSNFPCSKNIVSIDEFNWHCSICRLLVPYIVAQSASTYATNHKLLLSIVLNYYISIVMRMGVIVNNLWLILLNLPAPQTHSYLSAI